MLGKPDAQGKYPLSSNEYYAIRLIFAVISAFETEVGYLKERTKLKPGTWRDLRLISAKAQKVVDELLHTVPLKKIEQMKIELNNTFMTVDVRPIRSMKTPKRPDYVYIKASAIDGLIGSVMDIECFACEKRGREIKKCPLKEIIEDTFPYEIPDPDNDGCKFCGCHIDHEYNGHEEEDEKNAESEQVC